MPRQSALLLRRRMTLGHLLIGLTVWCVYLATWGPTKFFGVPAVHCFAQDEFGPVRSLWLPEPSVVVPLVLQQDDLRAGRREYYVWLLGPIFRWPWRTVLPVEAASGAT